MAIYIALIWTLMGQKKVSSLVRCSPEGEMHARAVLFREVSSVHVCPIRGVPLYV